VNGDERENPTVPKRRLRDGRHRPAAERVAAARAEQGSGLFESAAQRWGEDRERHLLQHGPPQPPKEVPTLETFAPRFVDGYARANRQKPSGIVGKESILAAHLIPQLGSKRLDAITSEEVQALKRHLVHRKPKTVNNVLTVLNMLLKKAVEWDVIERMPCAVRLLPVSKPSMGFYDFDEYERLVNAAKALDGNAYFIVLLGGEAGLRCGEIIALEWSDVNLGKRQLCVQRSEWRGHVTTPKSGRLRHVPMTVRLAAALREHRHLRAPRVICQRDGSALTQNMVSDHVRARGEARGIEHQRCSSPAAFVLFASRDARRTCACDPGARRASGSDHDAAVHALESRGDRGRDPVGGSARSG
jgi:integrase